MRTLLLVSEMSGIECCEIKASRLRTRPAAGAGQGFLWQDAIVRAGAAMAAK